MYQILIDRIAVPYDGACDWGLPNARSCSDCLSYYDPRASYGNNDGGRCVWSPDNAKCHTKKWLAKNDQTIDFNERCGKYVW